MHLTLLRYISHYADLFCYHSLILRAFRNHAVWLVQGGKTSRQSGEEGEEEQKRIARMQRNRESAMLSRQRKKMQLDELERQNKQLQASNTHLSGSLLYLSHRISCTSFGL